MRIAFTLFATATLVCSGAASAKEPMTESDKEDRIVCKTSKFVGSRISDRICKRRSEWAAGRENAQSALDKRERRSPAMQDHGVH